MEPRIRLRRGPQVGNIPLSKYAHRRWRRVLKTTTSTFALSVTDWAVGLTRRGRRFGLVASIATGRAGTHRRTHRKMTRLKDGATKKNETKPRRPTYTGPCGPVS